MPSARTTTPTVLVSPTLTGPKSSAVGGTGLTSDTANASTLAWSAMRMIRTLSGASAWVTIVSVPVCVPFSAGMNVKGSSKIPPFCTGAVGIGPTSKFAGRLGASRESCMRKSPSTVTPTMRMAVLSRFRGPTVVVFRAPSWTVWKLHGSSSSTGALSHIRAVNALSNALNVAGETARTSPRTALNVSSRAMSGCADGRRSAIVLRRWSPVTRSFSRPQWSIASRPLATRAIVRTWRSRRNWMLLGVPNATTSIMTEYGRVASPNCCMPIKVPVWRHTRIET